MKSPRVTLCCLCILVLITFPTLVPAEVEELDAITLAKTKMKATNPETPFLVMFYSPSCHFSKKALPVFLTASEALSGIFPRLSFAQIDAKKYAENLSGYEIPGYPTIMLLQNGTFVQYDDDNTIQKLAIFLEKNLFKSAVGVQ